MVEENGKVILKHWNSNPVTIQIDGKDYSFVPQHNISLAWVDKEYTDKVLQVKTKSCECNGGAYKPKFLLANELDISLWRTGDRPR